MSLDNLQNATLNYVSQSKLFITFIPYSKIITLIYGVYSVIYSLGFLNLIMQYVWCVGGILYFLSIIGLIISFAKNDMLPVIALFVLMAIGDLLSVIGSGMFGVSIQSAVYMVIYIYLAYKSLVRYNTSSTK